MTLQRKVFRIEQSEQEIVLEPGTERPAVAHDATPDMSPDPMPDLSAAQRHHELIAEIKALRALVEPKGVAQRILDTYQVQFATTLIESAPNAAEQEIGRAIQERVVKVFEACNFQDITGQRISKVVGTWKFIEGHVEQMMNIWGGMDAFKEFLPEAPPERQGDAALLNGPKLEEDVGHVSQDDIDALFP